LTRDSDGTINGFGNFVNALITVRNALGHVLNMFIRLYNVLPFLDNIGTIDMVDQLTTNFGELYGALSKTTQEMERQQKLKGFMGPVASRNLQDLTDYQKAYRDGLRETVDTEEQLTKSSGGSNKKLAEKKKSTEDAAKALKAYNEALTEAVENVRDKFSPALRDANENLTNAQNLYNDFYTGIRSRRQRRRKIVFRCPVRSKRKSQTPGIQPVIFDHTRPRRPDAAANHFEPGHRHRPGDQRSAYRRRRRGSNQAQRPVGWCQRSRRLHRQTVGRQVV
jgi:gas vesicle protein